MATPPKRNTYTHTIWLMLFYNHTERLSAENKKKKKWNLKKNKLWCVRRRRRRRWPDDGDDRYHVYVVAATGSPVIMGLSAPGTCDCLRRNQNRTRPVSTPTLRAPCRLPATAAVVFSLVFFFLPVILLIVTTSSPRGHCSSDSLLLPQCHLPGRCNPDLPPSTAATS